MATAAGNRPFLTIRFSDENYPMLELDFMPEAGYRRLQLASSLDRRCLGLPSRGHDVDVIAADKS
jgi:hypothetical protein